MVPRAVPLLAVGVLAACHGLFGGRTSDEDKALTSFAEYRERAATYYDGGDYLRAARQYEKALELRPRHEATRLAYAYCLMYTNKPSSLLQAAQQFQNLRRIRRTLRVKRHYGLAMTYRNLAADYERRARKYQEEGRLKEAEQDRGAARDYARDGRKLFTKVLEEEERKWSSLKPDAHVGLAHCAILLEDFEEALRQIETFAVIAAEAREFWERDRETRLATDPLVDNPETLTAQKRERYAERIARTVQEEAAIRTILMNTLFYLNRYPEGIEQCDIIEQLTPEDHSIKLLRGRAYGVLGRYDRALEDLEAYLETLPPRQTEHSVNVHQLIANYKERLRSGEP
ncbi:MAG: tetratricopeptide repeat protein [Planctomycetota bacterium]